MLRGRDLLSRAGKDKPEDVQVLSVAGLRALGIRDEDQSTFSALKEVDLSNNDLDRLPHFGLKQMPPSEAGHDLQPYHSLTVLNLSGNTLTSLLGLERYSNLIELDLTDNRQLPRSVALLAASVLPKLDLFNGKPIAVTKTAAKRINEEAKQKVMEVWKRDGINRLWPDDKEEAKRRLTAALTREKMNKKDIKAEFYDQRIDRWAETFLCRGPEQSSKLQLPDVPCYFPPVQKRSRVRRRPGTDAASSSATPAAASSAASTPKLSGRRIDDILPRPRKSTGSASADKAPTSNTKTKKRKDTGGASASGRKRRKVDVGSRRRQRGDPLTEPSESESDEVPSDELNAEASTPATARKAKAASRRSGRDASGDELLDDELPLTEWKGVTVRPATKLTLNKLLRAHGKQHLGVADDASSVWACCTSPPTHKDHQIVVTAGGQCICFVDVSLGIVRQKYTHQDEDFCCCDWTYSQTWTEDTVGRDEGAQAAAAKGKEMDLIAAAGEQGDIKIISYQQHACIAQLEGHGATVTSLKFCPTAPGILISADEQGVIFIWKLDPEGRVLFKRTTSTTSPVNTLDVMPVAGSMCVLTGHADGRVCLWKLKIKDNNKLALQLVLKEEEHGTGVMDCVGFLAGSAYFVTKATEERALKVCRIPSSLDVDKARKGRFSRIATLSWPLCKQYFMKFSTYPLETGGWAVYAGDHKGAVHVFHLPRKMAGLKGGQADVVYSSTSRPLRCPARGVVCVPSAQRVLAVYDANIVAVLDVATK